MDTLQRFPLVWCPTTQAETLTAESSRLGSRIAGTSRKATAFADRARDRNRPNRNAACEGRPGAAGCEGFALARVDLH